MKNPLKLLKTEKGTSIVHAASGHTVITFPERSKSKTAMEAIQDKDWNRDWDILREDVEFQKDVAHTILRAIQK